MAVFKCKMCGGDLHPADGATTCECEYCGSVQTIPGAADENLQALFNRANVLRLKSEFDKAESLYEKILLADATQADAYWGLILCKYGVEYVEDPKTFKRVPTCHRTSFDAITADEDYKSALEHADAAQSALYEREAEAIDAIQKGILAISNKEAPYDVFICYKEADDSGKRTVDSGIANDIYYQLTREGFKVFYAAISLEDKLGSEYEPYIFSALNSAKVMLCLGTKPEYFNAVWVKNEWSRFLRIMKQDRDRLLIPCYRDMDAYELPEEFAHLQAQDMSKVGFIPDIVRGIKKVIVKPEAESTREGTTMIAAQSGAAALLKRALISLEDGEWTKADDFAEQALNLEPENGEAYLAKLMAELKVRERADLGKLPQPFDDNGNYKRAVRFGGDALKAELTGYNNAIRERNETERKDAIYNKAMGQYKSTKDYAVCEQAAEGFRSIPGWRDADDLAVKAQEKAEVMRKDNAYTTAVELAEKGGVQRLFGAVELLQTIPGWKDADELLRLYEERLKQSQEALDKEMQEKAEARAKRRKEEERIAALRKVYNDKYSALLNSEKDTKKQLEETETSLAALTSTTLGKVMLIWGIIQVSLGILLIAVDGDTTVAAINIVIGGIVGYGGFSIVSKNSKTKKSLTAKQNELRDKLYQIEAVPSFEKFMKQQ